jgi:hypothetical protein
VILLPFPLPLRVSIWNVFVERVRRTVEPHFVDRPDLPAHHLHLLLEVDHVPFRAGYLDLLHETWVISR